MQLHLAFGVQRRMRWRNAATASSRVTFVEVGQLADGRWYVDRTREREGAYVFGPDERGRLLAVRTAQRLMDDGHSTWWPTVAAYGPDGEPCDGRPWVRRGGEWFLEES